MLKMSLNDLVHLKLQVTKTHTTFGKKLCLTNYREKIAETGKHIQRPTNEIQVVKPPDAYKKDDNVMYLVGPHELRIMRANLIDKAVIRDNLDDDNPSRLRNNTQG